MADDPIHAVYSYVERAYIRLQTGDVLIRCLEEGSAFPMQQMVEGLVLAGPKSLAVLREMLAEAGHRKSQVLDDLHQVYSDLESSLRTYGVQLGDVKGVVSVSRMRSIRFLSLMREQGIIEEEVQSACLQLMRDSRELMRSLARHINLLEEIEIYLRDWLWGLAYQSARNRLNDSQTPKSETAL